MSLVDDQQQTTDNSCEVESRGDVPFWASPFFHNRGEPLVEISTTLVRIFEEEDCQHLPTFLQLKTAEQRLQNHVFRRKLHPGPAVC